MTTIDVPGAVWTFASGIRSSGQIVGWFFAPGPHGFLRTTNDTLTTIDAPGAVRTAAYGTNDSGQIVGGFEMGGKTHGFVATRSLGSSAER